MSLRGLAVLLVVLLAIVSYVVWIDRPKENAEKSADLGPILDLEAPDVRSIELEHQGTTIALRRDGERSWRLVRPRSGEADPRRIDELLRSLKDARIQKVIEEKASDAKSFGLEPPESLARVFTAKRQTPETLRLGRRSPIGSQRYASVGDGRVLLVEDSLGEALERNPDVFEERRLAPVEADEIRRISISRPAGRLTLAREGTEWRLIEPVGDAADSGAADSLARSIAGLSVSEHSIGESPFGNGPVPIVVEIETTGGGRKKFEIGADETGEERGARRADRSLTGRVPDSEITELGRDAAEFRDHRVAVLPSEGVREVLIESVGARLKVTRDKEDGPWSVQDASGPAEPADPHKVDALLDRLHFARVESFEQGKITTKPDETVILRGAATELGRLEIGPYAPSGGGANGGTSSGARVYVKSSWRPGILMTVGSESLTPLPKGTADLAPDRPDDKKKNGS